MTSVYALLDEHDLVSLECIVPDFLGMGKGKVVTTADSGEGSVRLPEAVFGQDVIGDWCTDYALMDVADVDMLLVPDRAMLVPQPWSKQRRAQCLCDCRNLDGSPLAIAPHAILRVLI